MDNKMTSAHIIPTAKIRTNHVLLINVITSSKDHWGFLNNSPF